MQRTQQQIFYHARSSRNILHLMSKRRSLVFSALKHVVKRVRLRTARQRYGTAPLPRRSIAPHSPKNAADPGQPKDRRHPPTVTQRFFRPDSVRPKNIFASSRYEPKNQRDPPPGNDPSLLKTWSQTRPGRAKNISASTQYEPEKYLPQL